MLKLNAIATSYGLGPYHPAVLVDGEVHYWPNVTMETEEAAVARAQASLDVVAELIHDATRDWNTCKSFFVEA